MPTTVSSHAVIIDNATLRGALIALGLLAPPHAAPSEPIKIFDVHIASAEVLIESLLLYDHIYIPNIHQEYPNTVAQMQAVVGLDLIQELPLVQTQLKAIEKFAEQDFSSWPLAQGDLKIRLREFVGLEASLTQWDRWIFQQYSSVSAYYAWQSDTCTVYDYVVNHLDVVDARHIQEVLYQRFPSYHSAPQVEFWDAAVLWLTYRTCVYDCISWATGIPYVPHPQRAALWKAINIRRSQPAVFSQAPFDILFDARVTVGEQVNKALGIQLYDLDIPPFFTYVLAKSPSPLAVLNTVMELREERKIKALRTLLGNISAALDEKRSVAKVLQLRKQFDDLKEDLTAQYHDTTLPKISPTIQLAGVVGVQFDLPIPSTIRRLMSQLRTRNKPHLAVLRDIFRVTTDTWKLSHLYDKLYKGRQVLVERTITPPRGLESRGPEDIAEFTLPRTIIPVLPITRARELIADPKFSTPLQCREKMIEFLQEHPTESCQLALIDIDDLDMYNQRSRGLGDQVLQNVAVLIREAAGADPVSKVAGDTFIVVALGRSSDTWIQDLRTKVSALPLEEWLSRAREHSAFTAKLISVSVGLATSPADGCLADDLFKIAYERLGKEKHHKRRGA